jgi:hypothetical protein
MRNKTIVTARVLGLLVLMGWAWPAISQTEKRVAS